MFNKYNLINGDLELYIRGRPWLSVDDFDLDRFIDRQGLEHLFIEVLENKLSAIPNSQLKKNL